MQKFPIHPFLALIFCALAAQPLGAAEWSVKIGEKEIPGVVSADVKRTLGTDCIQLLDGQAAAIDIWFRAPVPLKAEPASLDKGLDNVAMATLLGVVQVHTSRRDYRDDSLRQGVFTMRYGQIPSDGNHLGAADYPYFLVLIPAAKDPKPDTYKTFKDMTKASLKDTTSEHPMILSLRPVRQAPAKMPVLETPAPKHKSVVLKITGQVAEKEKAIPLYLQLVIEGMGKQ